MNEKTNETKIEDYVETNVWELIKEKLENKIKAVNSISLLPDDLEDIAIELKVRKGSIALIREWMREVEGVAIQNKQGRDIMEKDEVVRTYE